MARGTRFLHTVTVPGISDNKLTLENILVDQALTVKIANYNLPALSNNGKSNRGKVHRNETLSLTFSTFLLTLTFVPSREFLRAPCHSWVTRATPGIFLSPYPFTGFAFSIDFISFPRNQSVEDGEKEDIYQIGLILIELITGKPAAGKEKLSALKSRVSTSRR